MAKTALYQKYRSSTFEEVVGQEYIVRSIKNAVRNDKVGHAYLFCGPRGTGKTTMARLLAKAVNCENKTEAPCEKCSNCLAAKTGTHPDIVEINAANETHVEDIRDLIERSRLAPMMGKYKIYIIDEVHQLSSAASSALLKTLEEPPENVIFILATTDPQKLLPTIISRCQRFDFSRVNKQQIQNHLLNIAEKENIYMDKEAAEMIAVLSDGGMRDALSIMDQCAAYTGDHITSEDIDRIYGLTTTEEKISLIEAVFLYDYATLLNKVRNYEERGIVFVRFTDGIIDILKDIFVYEQTNNPGLLKMIKKEDAEKLSFADKNHRALNIAEILMDTKERFKISSSAALAFEIGVLNSCAVPQQNQPVYKENTIPEKTTTSVVVSAKTEELIPIESTPVEIDIDKILQLLVQCSKNHKMEDEEKFKKMKTMLGLETRKFTSQLKDAQIAASGQDCILLVYKSKPIANRINATENNKQLYFFLKDQLQINKMIYAITDSDFKQASAQFRILMKEDRLPEAIEITKYKDSENGHEETSEEKVLKIFGKENVEIIEE